VLQVPEAIGVPVMTSLAFAIYLRATPQRVCEALIDAALVPDWLSGMSSGPAGEEDPRRLTCEWLLADYLEINGGCASVVQFELVAMGQVTRLMVNHRGLDPGGSLLKVITPGWPMILSSLKSLVETGEPLEFRLSA
jgi:Activator of Hsp90 ATPase homolog 1-like protein